MDLMETIKQHEGFRGTPYKCSEGVWTIGYGFTSITPDEAEAVLRLKIDKIKSTLNPVIKDLSPNRQNALVNMAYNLGIDGLFGFDKMWNAIFVKDFNKAASEMLDSKWALQVGLRAESLADKMRKG